MYIKRLEIQGFKSFANRTVLDFLPPKNGRFSVTGVVGPNGSGKSKVMAAHRGGIRTIICPKENEKDLKDIPKEIMKDLKVILVDHVDQVLVNALDIKNPKELFKLQKDANFGIKSNFTGQTQPQTH
jgi:ATP-dependent Lon protease